MSLARRCPRISLCAALRIRAARRSLHSAAAPRDRQPGPASGAGGPPDAPGRVTYDRAGYLTIDAPAAGICGLRVCCLWLRDFCRAGPSVDRTTGQKVLSTARIPVETGVARSGLRVDGRTARPRLWVEWTEGGESGLEHRSEFDVATLAAAQRADHWERLRHRTHCLAHTLWVSAADAPGASIAPRAPLVTYAGLKGASASAAGRRRGALEGLNRVGMVVFKGLGEEEKEVGELVRILGIELRRTFYGDLWDVRDLGAQAKNIANTSLPLGLHMDLVHFQNPPRFQFLHCLKNQVWGGESRFVDAYSVVARLLASDPQSFATLAREWVTFEYQNAGHHTTYNHPTIELKPEVLLDSASPSVDRFVEHVRRQDDWETHLLNALVAVNYSPPFQGPLYKVKDMRAFVVALKSFERLCELEEMKLDMKLEVGDCVGFDNRRILHARSAFRPKSVPAVSGAMPSSGQRWLKGAYVEGDSVWDRLRVLNSADMDPV